MERLREIVKDELVALARDNSDVERLREGFDRYTTAPPNSTFEEAIARATRRIDKQLVAPAEKNRSPLPADPRLPELARLALRRVRDGPGVLERGTSGHRRHLARRGARGGAHRHVHARSLLENLVRYCYFDSRPSLFVARSVLPEEDVRDVWADLLEEIQRLPRFQPALGDAAEAGLLFSEIEHAYRHSSRFVHGSTARYRSLYWNIRSIDLDAERARDLDVSLRRLGEACLLLLALYHLGPYLLVSQPIRRFMLRDAMDAGGRARFLRCMESVPVTWAQHQRAAALRTRRERRRKPFPTSDGLLLDRKGLTLVASPRSSTKSQTSALSPGRR